MEGTLNSSNSKSAVNPYFQRELPESAPTHIRNNLARHLGCRKVSNQQWSAYLDLIRLSGLFGFFSQSEQKTGKEFDPYSKQPGHDLLNTKNKTRWRFFLDYLQPFTPCWKNLLKKTETRKNIMKMDDLLIFTMLEKHKKLTEILQFGRMLTPFKKIKCCLRS